MKLETTFKTWLLDARGGSRDIIVITRVPGDEWYLLMNGDAYPVEYLNISIDEGYGFRPEYEYAVDLPDFDPLMATHVINTEEQAMIVRDPNGYLPFGMSDEFSPAAGFRIEAVCEDRQVYVFGSQDETVVHVLPIIMLEEDDLTPLPEDDE